MSAPDKVCRACLATKESFSYFLFENITADAYFFCTSVQVHDNEEFPKALCDPCFESLNRYLQFKQTCIDSQKTLASCGKNDDVLEKQEPDCFEYMLEKDQDIEVDTVVKLEIVPEQSNDEASSQEDPIAPTPTGSQIKVRKVRTTRRAKMIDGHKRKHTKQGAKSKLCLSCDVCDRKFRLQDKLDAHRLQHDGNTTLNCYACDHCDKSFSTHSGLSRHMESVHVRMRLSSARCGLCGRVCASPYALREHLRTHDTVRVKYVCHICGRPVTTPVILKAHLETHNAHRERSHTCERCGKKFFTNAILQSHIMRQHSGRQYICGICDLPFTDKHNLLKHINKHEGKKPYKCDFSLCEKAYSTKGALVEHKRVHSGERPFECSFCPKKFSSKKRLTDHHRIHTGERPHICPVCDHRFTQRGTMLRHLKVHNKEVAEKQIDTQNAVT